MQPCAHRFLREPGLVALSAVLGQRVGAGWPGFFCLNLPTFLQSLPDRFARHDHGAFRGLNAPYLLFGFGDGFVEIENIKQLGGVASDEEHRSGRVEEWKRTRLIQAGADAIVPDYARWPALAAQLWRE